MGHWSRNVRTGAIVLAAFVMTVAAEACRAPTQAMVTVTTTGPCSELGDVAIVATGDPATSESRVAGGFYAAQTKQCDAANTVGSLVVTPGGSRAVVIVITALPGQQLSTCTPPDYKGCIVARRAFSFIDNLTLDIPIPLEEDCRNVPCDAVTTCKKGVCLSAEVACDGSDCRLQGELPDGGIAPDAEVFVEGSTDHDSSSTEGGPNDSGMDASLDGGNDGGVDAGVDSGDDSGVVGPPPGGVTCTASNPPLVQCGSALMTCTLPGQACCENVMLADSIQCAAPTVAPCVSIPKGRRRYCCSDASCAAFSDTPHCSSLPGTPGNCIP
jgi:hypothetical protein